jgi:hypothetical protein
MDPTVSVHPILIAMEIMAMIRQVCGQETRSPTWAFEWGSSNAVYWMEGTAERLPF